MVQKILAVVLCLCLLTGCTGFQTSTEELLRPPRLTAEQDEMTNALIRAVGTENITFKYPKNGSYRSSFVFHDLDGDQQEEALVFYQADSMGSSTRIEVLDKQDETWFSVCSIPGGGEDVDFISFSHITSAQYEDVVVGWSYPVSQEKRLSIYQYNEEMIDTNFSESYNELVFIKENASVLEKVVLLSHGQSYNTASARLVVSDEGNLTVTSEQRLNDEISDFAQVMVGSVSADMQGVFIDERMSSGDIVTEVLTVKDDTLLSLLQPQEDEITVDTKRSIEVYCRDANKDGLMEVPTAQPMLGYEEQGEKERIYQTTFHSLETGHLEPLLSAVVNVESSFMIVLPERWIGLVTVVAQPETGEMRFFEYKESLTDQSSMLLRIRVYSQNDYHDKFEQEYFTLLDKKGLFEYYGNIPAGGDEQLQITMDELRGMFVKLI